MRIKGRFPDEMKKRMIPEKGSRLHAGNHPVVSMRIIVITSSRVVLVLAALLAGNSVFGQAIGEFGMMRFLGIGTGPGIHAHNCCGSGRCAWGGMPLPMQPPCQPHRMQNACGQEGCGMDYNALNQYIPVPSRAPVKKSSERKEKQGTDDSESKSDASKSKTEQSEAKKTPATSPSDKKLHQVEDDSSAENLEEDPTEELPRLDSPDHKTSQRKDLSGGRWVARTPVAKSLPKKLR